MIYCDGWLYSQIAVKLLERMGDNFKTVVDTGFSDNSGRWTVACNECMTREMPADLPGHWQNFTIDLKYEVTVLDNRQLATYYTVLAGKCRYCETIHFARCRCEENS